jgi:hypothetical protein
VNENEVSEIRRAVVREPNPNVLRRWCLRLLEDRAALRDELVRLREFEPKGAPISLGAVDSQKGRE